MLASKSYTEISVERTSTTRLKLRAILTLNQHTAFQDYLAYQRPQINPYYPSHMKLLEYLSISSSNLPSRKHSFEITRSKRLAINRIITHFYFSVKVTVHCCNIIFQLKWLSMVKVSVKWLSMVKSESECPWLMFESHFYFKCLSKFCIKCLSKFCISACPSFVKFCKKLYKNENDNHNLLSSPNAINHR